MTKEYSYGAVVYKFVNDELYVIVEHMKLGHISIPKGHIEEGETPLKCAKREIKEETNIDAEIDMSFSHTVTYSPYPGISKDVTFFLAEPITEDLISQPEEVKMTEWVEINQAIKMMTFDTDKETLRAAYDHIKEHA